MKLTVAAVVPADGMLVLNADDELLRMKARALAQRFGRAPRLGWFSLAADSGPLVEHRAGGGSTCGVRNDLSGSAMTARITIWVPSETCR